MLFVLYLSYILSYMYLYLFINIYIFNSVMNYNMFVCFLLPSIHVNDATET